MGGAALPLGKKYFVAEGNVFMNNVFHGVGEGFAVDGDGAFVVQIQAAFVEVGGSDQ